MMHIFTILAVILALPVLVLWVQVLAAIVSTNGRRQLSQAPQVQSGSTQASSIQHRPTLAVLMPAHNESLVITQTIQSILPQLTSQDQLLVVADNCTDDTAAIAKKLGATVVERSHQTARGKGFALDFGLQHLKIKPPQVVLVIDADCIVAPDAIAALARACLRHQRPIQALYLMESQPNPSLKARIASFAWVVKNKVRPLGALVLHLPCQLMGTGMAFLWEDIIQANLASGHIVEDMKLGVDLTRLNKPPLFLPQALVTSVFPPTAAATNTQRARWEHGHLSVILSEAPRLLFESIKTMNMQMLGLVCDLIVPPLAVLTLMCLSLFIACFLLSAGLGLHIASILMLCLASAILLAWMYFGREIISLKQLCYAPIYALVKIPLYIKFFMNRQVEWVRSKRD